MTANPAKRPLSTSKEVWEHFVNHGGITFSPPYDVELLDCVQRELRLLGIAIKPTLEGTLKSEPVSVEQMLFAFFRAIAPYAAMFRELLSFYAMAGAKRAKKNALIAFDFDAANRLGLDLSAFKTFIAKAKKIEAARRVNVWNLNTLIMLAGVFRTRAQHPPPLEGDVAKWDLEYTAGRWPAMDLPPPRSGNVRLDTLLERVWEVWRSIVESSRHINVDRAELRNASGELSVGGWTTDLLVWLDRDNWAMRVAIGAYGKVACLSRGDPADATKLADELDDLFSIIPKKTIRAKSVRRMIDELLSLPIWSARHELYSAWVVTRTVTALEPLAPKIIMHDQTLLFAFKAAKLVEFTKAVIPLELWLELRTPLTNVASRKRKRGIQPDHTVTRTPAGDAGNSEVVVECKQYWGSSNTNFAAALNDYAHGRPNALVVLVNYGPIRTSLLSRVDAKFLPRVVPIGDFRPGESGALEEFRYRVWKHLKPKAIPSDAPASVTLRWNGLPRDLDLRLAISGFGPVDFGNRGSLTAAPFAELEKDKRDGDPPEVIRISHWMPTVYRFGVCAFSKDGDLASSDAYVEFTTPRGSWKFHCPRIGTGDWWAVFEYDVASGVPTELGKLGQVEDLGWASGRPVDAL